MEDNIIFEIKNKILRFVNSRIENSKYENIFFSKRKIIEEITNIIEKTLKEELIENKDIYIYRKRTFNGNLIEINSITTNELITKDSTSMEMNFEFEKNFFNEKEKIFPSKLTLEEEVLKIIVSSNFDRFTFKNFKKIECDHWFFTIDNLDAILISGSGKIQLDEIKFIDLKKLLQISDISNLENEINNLNQIISSKLDSLIKSTSLLTRDRRFAMNGVESRIAIDIKTASQKYNLEIDENILNKLENKNNEF